MEPTKLENKIQSELKNRTIEPSAAAWDRLDAMLSVAESKPKRKILWWPAVASIIAFFGIAAVLFLQSEPLVDKANDNEVVNTETIKNDEVIVKNDTLVNKTTSNVVAQNSNISSKGSKIAIKTVPKVQTITEQRKKSQNEIIEADKSQIAIIENTTLPITVENKVVAPKYINPATLLADIESKTTDKKLEIALQNQPLKTNAKSLLTEVDTELELSFRERALKKIKKTYVAIAERNNLK